MYNYIYPIGFSVPPGLQHGTADTARVVAEGSRRLPDGKQTLHRCCLHRHRGWHLEVQPAWKIKFQDVSSLLKFGLKYIETHFQVYFGAWKPCPISKPLYYIYIYIYTYIFCETTTHRSCRPVARWGIIIPVLLLKRDIIWNQANPTTRGFKPNVWNDLWKSISTIFSPRNQFPPSLFRLFRAILCFPRSLQQTQRFSHPGSWRKFFAAGPWDACSLDSELGNPIEAVEFTLWLCQNSYWKWPFIVDFPIKNGDFP